MPEKPLDRAPGTLSRRNFTTGAAWAAPVVAVTVAAPIAAAASEAADADAIVRVRMETVSAGVARASVEWLAGAVPTGAMVSLQLSPNYVPGHPGYLSWALTGTTAGLIAPMLDNTLAYSTLTLAFAGSMDAASVPSIWSADVEIVGLAPGWSYTGSWGIFPNAPGTNLSYAGSHGGSVSV